MLRTSRLVPGRRAAIEHLARATPRELGDESAAAFYSGPTSLSEPVRLCIPRLDPGGDPSIRERETVEGRASKTLVGSRRQVRPSFLPRRLQHLRRRGPLRRRPKSSHELEFRYGTPVAMTASPSAGRSTTTTGLRGSW